MKDQSVLALGVMLSSCVIVAIRVEDECAMSVEQRQHLLRKQTERMHSFIVRKTTPYPIRRVREPDIPDIPDIPFEDFLKQNRKNKHEHEVPVQPDSVPPAPASFCGTFLSVSSVTLLFCMLVSADILFT